MSRSIRSASKPPQSPCPTGAAATHVSSMSLEKIPPAFLFSRHSFSSSSSGEPCSGAGGWRSLSWASSFWKTQVGERWIQGRCRRPWSRDPERRIGVSTGEMRARGSARCRGSVPPDSHGLLGCPPTSKPGSPRAAGGTPEGQQLARAGAGDRRGHPDGTGRAPGPHALFSFVTVEGI